MDATSSAPSVCSETTPSVVETVAAELTTVAELVVAAELGVVKAIDDVGATSPVSSVGGTVQADTTSSDATTVKRTATTPSHLCTVMLRVNQHAGIEDAVGVKMLFYCSQRLGEEFGALNVVRVRAMHPADGVVVGGCPSSRYQRFVGGVFYGLPLLHFGPLRTHTRPAVIRSGSVGVDMSETT